ncbi:MAG: D-alanyl-D-alanine carboxypeptidase, partial [Romboutsia sp.]|uniref:D-alanyl-D-alanine carboxypeptidase family protein n=1 Tax=Romboutsia sp. TaxID=1965302 RepID=UPI00216D1B63
MKKIFSFVLTLLITFLPVFNTNNLSFADSELNLTAEYAILMDYETGQVLYSKNGNSKLYPASTTKAWTAYVVLKHVNDLNQVVEIKDLPIVDGSSMYLKEGEAFTVKELLDALLIHSSNDVAMVLAKYVGGSVENFVNMMNDEAKSIGAENTHFNNPHGLPDENHYTTAYDMALMARKAMDNKIFRDIVNTKSVKYPATEAYPYERYFENTNQFLTSRSKMNYKGQEIDIKYDVVDGIKTGYTDAAGKCLLSTGVKNNIRVISAVFKSTVDDLYLDSRTLLDYGFDNFYVKEIVDKDDFIKNKKVFLSKEKKLIYQPEANYSVALSNDSKADDYSIKTKLDERKVDV